MTEYKVTFAPFQKTVVVPGGTTVLEAAGKALIAIDSVCGGDGICGRCTQGIPLPRHGIVRCNPGPP